MSPRHTARTRSAVSAVLIGFVSSVALAATGSHAPGHDARPAPPAQLTRSKGCAEAIIVTTSADNGAGSLRQAVADLCAGGGISFDAGLEIALASEILIDKAVTIVGDASEGAGLQRILAGDGFRAFRVASTGNLALERIRISGGAVAEFGGAVRNAGTLTLLDCRLDANRSGDNVSFGGGAIFNDVGATLLVDRCTFHANLGARGSALFNSGAAQIRNSTFSGNINAGNVTEGAIQNRGTLLAEHVTVTNNGRSGVGGIGGLFAFNATTTLVNSIIAGNLNEDCRFSGGTSTTIALLAVTGNCAAEFRQDPQLEALADNGGPTQTVALADDSPARDVADATLCLDVDQRGLARPQGIGCDLGAFEREVLTPDIFGDGFEALPPPSTVR